MTQPKIKIPRKRAAEFYNAVTRPLEVIGEAARLISQPTRDAHPEIPWNKMINCATCWRR